MSYYSSISGSSSSLFFPPTQQVGVPEDQPMTSVDEEGQGPSESADASNRGFSALAIEVETPLAERVCRVFKTSELLARRRDAHRISEWKESSIPQRKDGLLGGESDELERMCSEPFEFLSRWYVDQIAQSTNASNVALSNECLKDIGQAPPVTIHAVLTPYQRKINSLPFKEHLFQVILLEGVKPALAKTPVLRGMTLRTMVDTPWIRALVRWIAYAGLVEGWIKPPPIECTQEREIASMYVECIKTFEHRLGNALSRIIVSDLAAERILADPEGFFDRWEMLRPFLTFAKASQPLCLATLMGSPLEQVRNMVTRASADILTTGAVDWERVCQFEGNTAEWMHLIELVDARAGDFLISQGINYQETAIRLMQNPVAILHHKGISVQHLEKLNQKVRQQVLTHPWEFGSLAEIWPDIGEHLATITPLLAKKFEQKVWGLKMYCAQYPARFENLCSIFSQSHENEDQTPFETWHEQGSTLIPPTTSQARFFSRTQRHRIEAQKARWEAVFERLSNASRSLGAPI